MYLCVKQQLKKQSKEAYLILRELCHIAKNLHNVAVYNIRQHFFQTKEFLPYPKNYPLCKENENYKLLNSNMSQQILKEVDGEFRSFFALTRLVKEGKYPAQKVRIPKYLEKDAFATLVIGMIRIKRNKLIVPYSNTYRKGHPPIEITIPPNLLDKNIKEIRIVPKCKARFFEIQYTYEVKEEQRDLDQQKALSIDLGINNLATCVTSEGKSFIIDGKRLKSMNQEYNKNNARLQSIKAKQKIQGMTKQQANLLQKRNHRVNDYMSKSCRIIINYCLEQGIGKLVLGYNESFQVGASLGKRNNQNFVQIPFGKMKQKLKYLCQYYGISFVKQEESYTSKASFFDQDPMPVFGDKITPKPLFSGKRIYRGLYQRKSGQCLNSDQNGALNILVKSSVVDLTVLYIRGEVDTPIRIKIA